MASLKETILVVDDDPQEQEALAQIVSTIGYSVQTAAGGEEALAKLNAGNRAAMVADLMMARMDGFELLRTLADQGSQTPVIVLTGFGSISQAVSVVHDLRAFWFLEKPAQPVELGTLLERA